MFCNLKGLLASAGIALTLAACSTGPVEIGPDTYMAASTGTSSWSSGSVLKADLYRQAAEFCRTQGKQAMPAHTSQNDGSMSDFAHAELDFRCLAQGDPMLQRPQLRTEPHIVIENRTVAD